MKALWRENMLQNGIWQGPIMDQHLHLDRTNSFLEAISDFTRMGGTGVMLVHKPRFSGSLPVDLDGYREAYSETIDMATEVRTRFKIDVGVVLGPHPVVWEKQIDGLGIEGSTELHMDAVSLALDFIEAGQANCLGEVGRPHYQVSKETWDSANDLLIDIMSMASSTDSSLQLHVEDNGAKTTEELSLLCGKSKFPIGRAIRHFAPANVSAEFTSGLPATVNVGTDSVEGLTSSAKEANAPWGMETDFLDDPKRPGAVLGPKTVPKRTQELCSSLLSNGWDEGEVEDLMFQIHDEWPKKLYLL
tara:strand:- start:345 stop:1253 length:909 start_codon:yes stop_codon:yes gene_type:complete